MLPSTRRWPVSSLHPRAGDHSLRKSIQRAQALKKGRSVLWTDQGERNRGFKDGPLAWSVNPSGSGKQSAALKVNIAPGGSDGFGWVMKDIFYKQTQ